MNPGPLPRDDAVDRVQHRSNGRGDGVIRGQHRTDEPRPAMPTANRKGRNDQGGVEGSQGLDPHQLESGLGRPVRQGRQTGLRSTPQLSRRGADSIGNSNRGRAFSPRQRDPAAAAAVGRSGESARQHSRPPSTREGAGFLHHRDLELLWTHVALDHIRQVSVTQKRNQHGSGQAGRQDGRDGTEDSSASLPPCHLAALPSCLTASRCRRRPGTELSRRVPGARATGIWNGPSPVCRRAEYGESPPRRR